MVDQADFQPIDAYIRAHGLNDASMAAERRAKIHNVNKPAAGEEAGNGEEDGRGEIEKAEALLQDQEDEEEEDYDPSGGESEGSGEDSDEEDGEGKRYRLHGVWCVCVWWWWLVVAWSEKEKVCGERFVFDRGGRL